MKFSDLNLNKNILRSLEEKGYAQPTEVQKKTIPKVLEGDDVIVSAQTGTGKTAAFALPILHKLFDKFDAAKKGKTIKALVVSPTRELAQQIQENFNSYGKYSNLRTVVLYGGVSIEPQKEKLSKGVDVVIATPGRLLDLHKQEVLNLSFVEVLVLDEADLMLDMGFIDDVLKINRLCLERKQTLLFSATLPQKIVDFAKEALKSPTRIAVSPNGSVANTVSQYLYYTPKPKKIELCLHLLRNTIKGTIIVFRRTKFGVDKLEKTLVKNGYKVASIHGDKTQGNRQEALEMFKSNDVNILIATDVASRGIDIQGVDAVVNFDMPNISETYVHRIGRSGRAGKLGKSYSFCSADEKNYVTEIQKLIKIQIPIVVEHPYPLDPKQKPEVHKKQGSKHKKGRKSASSKKRKKRWY